MKKELNNKREESEVGVEIGVNVFCDPSSGKGGCNKVVEFHDLSLQKVALMKKLKRCTDKHEQVKLANSLAIIEVEMKKIATANFHTP